jgi:hypothetical protein
MVSNYGMSGIDYIDDFIIYPKYEIFDYSEVQTQIKNVHSIKAELTLIVLAAKTQKVFGSYTQKLEGAHDSRERAITKSISRIKTRGDDIEDFLNGVKEKIIKYYKNNCTQLDKDAAAMIRNGAYEKAIHLLNTVPRGLSGDCFNSIQLKLNQAYNGYNNVHCQSVIRDAEKAIAEKKESYARALLKGISSSSRCYTAAQKLIDKINTSAAKKESGTSLPKVVKEKLVNRRKMVEEQVAKSVSLEDDDDFRCKHFNDGCH